MEQPLPRRLEIGDSTLLASNLLRLDLAELVFVFGVTGMDNVFSLYMEDAREIVTDLAARHSVKGVVDSGLFLDEYYLCQAENI